MAITNDLPSVFCWVSQMASSPISSSIRTGTARSYIFWMMLFTLGRHQLLILGLQLFFAFFVLGIQRDAVHRTHVHTLRRVVVAYAFGAFIGVDDINGIALRDRVVRAFRLAYVAIDTFVGNHSVSYTHLRAHETRH